MDQACSLKVKNTWDNIEGLMLKLKRKSITLPDNPIDAILLLIESKGGRLEIGDIDFAKIYLVLYKLGLFNFDSKITIQMYGPVVRSFQSGKENAKRMEFITHHSMIKGPLSKSVYQIEQSALFKHKKGWDLDEFQILYLKNIIDECLNLKNTNELIDLSYYATLGRFGRKLIENDFRSKSIVHNTLIDRYNWIEDRLKKNIEATPLLTNIDVSCDDLINLLMNMSLKGQDDLKTTNPGLVYLEILNMIIDLKGKACREIDLRDIAFPYQSHLKMKKYYEKELSKAKYSKDKIKGKIKHHSQKLDSIEQNLKTDLELLIKYKLIRKQAKNFSLVSKEFKDNSGDIIHLMPDGFYKGIKSGVP